jgi:hypothetical protein
MKSSFPLALLALLCCIVHGFSSPQTMPRTEALRDRFMKSTPRFPLAPRGGAKGLATAPISTGTKCPATGAATIAASLWGAGGVIYILAKAIKRVLPIAVEPFKTGSVPLSKIELGYVDMVAIDVGVLYSYFEPFLTRLLFCCFFQIERTL